MEEKINKYIQASREAIRVLSAQKGIKITDMDFQVALGSKFEYERTESHYTVSKALSAEQMIELMKDFSFEKPIIIVEVVFQKSIIPEGIPVALNEQKVKSKGEIWVIHKYDTDPFPSNPHAHNKSTGYKLHLGTGELFDSKNNSLKRSISKKDLLALRDKVMNTTLPALAV